MIVCDICRDPTGVADYVVWPYERAARIRKDRDLCMELCPSCYRHLYLIVKDTIRRALEARSIAEGLAGWLRDVMGCPVCQGEGATWVDDGRGGPLVMQPCPRCKAAQQAASNPAPDSCAQEPEHEVCPRCGGYGVVVTGGKVNGEVKYGNCPECLSGLIRERKADPPDTKADRAEEPDSALDSKADKPDSGPDFGPECVRCQDTGWIATGESFRGFSGAIACPACDRGRSIVQQILKQGEPLEPRADQADSGPDPLPSAHPPLSRLAPRTMTTLGPAVAIRAENPFEPID